MRWKSELPLSGPERPTLPQGIGVYTSFDYRIHPPSGGSEASLRVSGEGAIGGCGREPASSNPSPKPRSSASTLPREGEGRCVDTNALWERSRSQPRERAVQSAVRKCEDSLPAATASDLPRCAVVQFLSHCFATRYFILPLGESDAVAAGEGFWCLSVRLSLANRIGPLLAKPGLFISVGWCRANTARWWVGIRDRRCS